MESALRPLIVYYESGKAEQLRVPTVSATKDLVQIISRLIEVYTVEPQILTFLRRPEATPSKSYLVEAIGGNLKLSGQDFVQLAASYLDQAVRLIDTFSGSKLDWRQMLFHPAQVEAIFFGNALFKYIEDELAFVVELPPDPKDGPPDPKEQPQNDLESWGASLAGLLRTGKTPRGMKELLCLSRGELAAMTKFYNLTEKKLHPDSDEKSKGNIGDPASLKKAEELRDKMTPGQLEARRKAREKIMGKTLPPTQNPG